MWHHCFCCFRVSTLIHYIAFLETEPKQQKSADNEVTTITVDTEVFLITVFISYMNITSFDTATGIAFNSINTFTINDQ